MMSMLYSRRNRSWMISMCKQPEKSAAKSEPQRNRTFRLINEGGIVQSQLADRCLQMFEVAGVDRINPAENHRMNFLKTGQRLARGMPLVGDRVADLHVGSRFDIRDEITDVAGI